MAKYTEEQRKDIIIKNPNKQLIQHANEQRKKLMLQINGVGLKDAMSQYRYYENDKVFPERSSIALSNKDLFRRILGEEDQVFTARGGSAIYNLKTAKKEAEFAAKMANVRYGWSLHKWMQNMAIHAYRSDPMGLIFIETEQVQAEGQQITMPQAYPTYKCSADIHDYELNGRKLEYVCFKLNREQQIQLGIAQPDTTTMANSAVPFEANSYYRFVDDSEDVIYKLEGGNITDAQLNNGQQSRIKNVWGKVAGFIVSDLMRFDKPQHFASPVDNIIELAESFLRDRSIRDLSKLYHGFPKAYEPMLSCPTCRGEGVKAGKACPTCTLPGMDVGTGYKPDTKVGDIAKFPLDVFKELPSLKIADIFGYVTPDIAGWDKQDTSLDCLERLMKNTYWNTSSTEITFNGTQNTEKTATEALINLQPKYARLNTTADWAERTETMITDLLGEYYEGASWSGASISYGRGYILETPNDVFAQYQTMIKGGCPDIMLDEQFEKYIKCLYQNSPITQAKYLKLFEVEPFPHRTAQNVEMSTLIPLQDKLAKIYFGEWEDTLKEDYIIVTPVEQLRKDLKAYIADKTTEVKAEQDAKAAQQQPSIN